jgi:hypothetical protein
MRLDCGSGGGGTEDTPAAGDDVGGLGCVADKIVMHPRRWGSFVAAVDTTNRPILGISGLPAFNVDGQGISAGYGYVHFQRARLWARISASDSASCVFGTNFPRPPVAGSSFALSIAARCACGLGYEAKTRIASSLLPAPKLVATFASEYTGKP